MLDDLLVLVLPVRQPHVELVVEAPPHPDAPGSAHAEAYPASLFRVDMHTCIDVG